MKKDLDKNIVYVSRNLNDDNLWTKELPLKDVVLRCDKTPEKVLVRLRHRAPLIEAKFDGKKIIFKNEVKRPASGQSVVIYDDQICLGGGIID